MPSLEAVHGFIGACVAIGGALLYLYRKTMELDKQLGITNTKLEAIHDNIQFLVESEKNRK